MLGFHGCNLEGMSGTCCLLQKRRERRTNPEVLLNRNGVHVLVSFSSSLYEISICNCDSPYPGGTEVI